MKQHAFLSYFFLLFIAQIPAQQKFTLNEVSKIQVYETDQNSNSKLNLSSLNYHIFDFKQPKETDACIFINPDKTFQTLEGIGGAITDASAETFYKLPLSKQKEILNAYFNKEKGIGYTLIRTNINSCDFSSSSYTYVQENDKSLQTFSIAQDKKYKIPMIKEAQNLIGKEFKLYISPWSPPAFMKDTKNMLQGGRLLDDYYQTWADYFIKFINEYQKLNLPIWGMTIQNEPMAKQRWESCIFTAEEEGKFLGDYLGPTLEKNGMADKKIIFWDHNRDLIVQRASTTLSNPKALKYAWGIGFHWYETWNNKQNLHENTEEVQKSFPHLKLLFTEGCREKFNYNELYDWKLGELYGRNMINDFNNGTVAWTDWNILLDETGGPNHVGNFCFAPIIGNTKTNEIIYTNEYFYIGHFSKFIRPGAQRVSSSSNRADLLATSFLNTNGTLVTVVMNESEKEINYNLWIKARQLN